MSQSSALQSSKKSRRLAVALDGKIESIDGKVEAHATILGQTAAVVNAHTKAFFARGFFGRLWYLVSGR